MALAELAAVAGTLVAPGKGLLAADESPPTLGRRFEAAGIPNTAETRRRYRQLLFTTPGVEAFISGVILHEETLEQAADDGTPFAALLVTRGILPGLKVDRGTVPLAGAPGERVTEGLDGLRERLNAARERGVRFTKWRAVLSIAAAPRVLPSRLAIEANAHALARYAALSQEAGLVPIVEPEVLMDGDHSLERCQAVTEATLEAVFRHLREHGVALEGLLLKPSMVLPGSAAPAPAPVEAVAEATLTCLRRTVPAAVAGVVFLSGGQPDRQATAHLDAMNRRGPQPWPLSFSYARALQSAALRAWGGDPAREEEARRAFYHRARCNSAARFGRYGPELEEAA